MTQTCLEYPGVVWIVYSIYPKSNSRQKPPTLTTCHSLSFSPSLWLSHIGLLISLALATWLSCWLRAGLLQHATLLTFPFEQECTCATNALIEIMRGKGVNIIFAGAQTRWQVMSEMMPTPAAVSLMQALEQLIQQQWACFFLIWRDSRALLEKTLCFRHRINLWLYSISMTDPRLICMNRTLFLCVCLTLPKVTRCCLKDRVVLGTCFSYYFRLWYKL